MCPYPTLYEQQNHRLKHASGKGYDSFQKGNFIYTLKSWEQQVSLQFTSQKRWQREATLTSFWGDWANFIIFMGFLFLVLGRVPSLTCLVGYSLTTFSFWKMSQRMGFVPKKIPAAPKEVHPPKRTNVPSNNQKGTISNRKFTSWTNHNWFSGDMR